MSTSLLLLSADQFIRIGACIAILRFAFLLRRARKEGGLPVFTGCIAILLGECFKLASFTGMGSVLLWTPGLLLTSFGYCAVAYGFGKLVRSAIKT